MSFRNAAIAKGLQTAAVFSAMATGDRGLIYTHSEAQEALRIRKIDHRQDGNRKDSERSGKARFGGFFVA